MRERAKGTPEERKRGGGRAGRVGGGHLR